jgi:hypothetical protein
MEVIMLRVKISHVRNPGIPGGYWAGCAPTGPRTRWVAVATLDEAASACRAFIDEHDIGAGNWTGGEVQRDGEPVARVSYNGRVWLPDGTEAKVNS